MEALDQQLKAYIDGHRQEMLDLWKEIVDTESGPKQIAGVNAVGTLLQRELEQAGAAVRRVPAEQAGDLIVGDWNPEAPGKPVVFMGHMDTVFPAGEAERNPFRVDEEGNAHGPGVLDMKAGLVIGLYALKALQSIGWKERPIRFLGVPDEETLHMFSNAKALIAQETAGAGAVFNFEPGPLGNKLVIGRYGGGPVSITVHGVAAHSGSAPEKGRSAVLEAAHKIIELEAANDIPRGKLINCGAVEGGIGENTIPDSCKIRIGIRYRNAAIGDEIFALLRQVTEQCTVEGTWAELDVSRVMQCMDTTEGVKALYTHVADTGEALGMGRIEGIQVGGLSDAGIPAGSGIPTLCGMGVRGEGAHTDREYAQVESLYERCLLAAAAVRTL
ncbi:M20 family metallopeptidase [Acidaminococcus sp. LBK-2]|uniref:M20 family metallopeptidase n=1 Tax=Acidaminococcus sp. LBK-2 TaxID=3456956 RepID=UPI003FA4BF7C